MHGLSVHLQSLKKPLRRRGRTCEEAEVLVQEAFVRMQVYCQQGGVVREPEAFLARTVFNLEVDARLLPVKKKIRSRRTPQDR